MSAACDLLTGQVEEPADQGVERASWQEAFVGQAAHQDQKLGLDQCQLAIEVRAAEVDLSAAEEKPARINQPMRTFLDRPWKGNRRTASTAPGAWPINMMRLSGYPLKTGAARGR